MKKKWFYLPILTLGMFFISCEKEELDPNGNGNGNNNDETCDVDYSQSGTVLNLAGVCDLPGKAWGPQSNDIQIPGGLNYSTTPGFGWSVKLGDKYTTGFSLRENEDNDFTTTTQRDVIITLPEGAVAEVWDLDNLVVLASNTSNSSENTIEFTTIAETRIGGFAWYTDNRQDDLLILAEFDECNVSLEDAGTVLELEEACDAFSLLWAPTSNGIDIPGGINSTTQLGFGWAKEIGGKYVARNSISKDLSWGYTVTTQKNLRLVVPEGVYAEIWDVTNSVVVATNVNEEAGDAIEFTVLPQNKYGIFSWYEDNRQEDLPLNIELID